MSEVIRDVRELVGSGAVLALTTLFLLLGPGPTLGTGSGSVHMTRLDVSRGADIGAPKIVAAPGAELGYRPDMLSEMHDVMSLPGDQEVTLGITLNLRDSTGLASLATSPAVSGEGGHGHFLSRTAFLDRFAPTALAHSTVQKTFQAAGFNIIQSYEDRSFLLVRGSSASAEKLFSTKLVQGSIGGKMVVLPSSPPVLPSGIAPYVSSVTGLSQGVGTFSVDSMAAPRAFSTPITPNAPHSLYGIDDLYNVTGSSSWPTNERIALLLWGDGYNPNDINTFLSQIYPSTEPPFNLIPTPLFGAPAPSPSATSDPSGTAFEMTLDIEWSGSQAPGATIIPTYVPDGPQSRGYSPSDVDLENALAYIVNNENANVLSMSFGAPDGQDIPFQNAFDQSLEIGAAQGMSSFASSGDNGGAASASSTTSCTSTPQVEYPGVSPWVTAVGGTNPTAGLGGKLSSETAWQWSTGGFSTTNKAPSWQLTGSAGAAIQSKGGGQRGVPDVSGPSTDNVLYYNSSLRYGAGTSFASPMWAGISAEMDHVHGSNLGMITPALYRVGTSQDSGVTPIPFNYVTQGANCIYSATSGWDPITGWGSPASALVVYGDIIGGLVTLSLSFNPAVATPGQQETVTVTATNGSTPLSGLPVGVEVYSQPITGQPKVLHTLVITTGSSGSGTGSFAVSATYAYQSILVKASVSTSLAIGVVSGIVDVSVLGWWGPLQPLVSDYPINIVFFLLLMGLATAIGWALGRKRQTAARGQVPVRRPATQSPSGASANQRPSAYPGSATPAAARRPTPIGMASAPARPVMAVPDSSAAYPPQGQPVPPVLPSQAEERPTAPPSEPARETEPTPSLVPTYEEAPVPTASDSTYAEPTSTQESETEASVSQPEALPGREESLPAEPPETTAVEQSLAEPAIPAAGEAPPTEEADSNAYPPPEVVGAPEIPSGSAEPSHEAEESQPPESVGEEAVVPTPQEQEKPAEPRPRTRTTRAVRSPKKAIRATPKAKTNRAKSKPANE